MEQVTPSSVEIPLETKETLLTPVISRASTCLTVVDLSSTGRPAVAQEPSQIKTSSNHPPPPPAQPPRALTAAVSCPSHPPSSPGSPGGPITAHVLTHLIEGFVIQEGLEPFQVIFCQWHDICPLNLKSLKMGDNFCPDYTFL